MTKEKNDSRNTQATASIIFFSIFVSEHLNVFLLISNVTVLQQCVPKTRLHGRLSVQVLSEII